MFRKPTNLNTSPSNCLAIGETMKKLVRFIKGFLDWLFHDPLQAYKDKEYQDRVNRQIRERMKRDSHFL